jgi:hypothetical protein
MAIGLNCALGASDMKKYIANLSACADCFVFCYPNAGLPNAMGGYDQKGHEMAEEVRPFFEEGLLNGVGGCCGTTPEHIAAIRAVASTFPPRELHDVEPLLRISGLEPFNYEPDASNMRRTFMNIGERCNVAGSTMFKKAIVDGDYDKALSIALKQVGRGQAFWVWGGGAAGAWDLHMENVSALETPADHALFLPWPPLDFFPGQVQQGADVLDINMDDGLIDGMAAMTKFVNLCISGGSGTALRCLADPDQPASWSSMRLACSCLGTCRSAASICSSLARCLHPGPLLAAWPARSSSPALTAGDGLPTCSPRQSPPTDFPALPSCPLPLPTSDPEISRVPFMIDSSKFHIVEAGLKCSQGKCIVNSISLKEGEEAFRAHAQLVKRHGAAVVVMAFDESGQAATEAEKVSMCCRAYRILVEEVGFNPQDIIFDPNILTVGTGLAEHNNYAVDFFRATREIKRLCPGAKVSGGVSNIAFSFRGNEAVRRAFHSAFLHHACRAGMDMGIVNAVQVRVVGRGRVFGGGSAPVCMAAAAPAPACGVVSPCSCHCLGVLQRSLGCMHQRPAACAARGPWLASTLPPL